MLKTIRTKYENTIIVGEASEIKAVYKAMARAWRDDRTETMPLYRKQPTLTDYKMYGIVIEYDEFFCHNVFKVITADVVLRSILDSDLVKVVAG